MPLVKYSISYCALIAISFYSELVLSSRNDRIIHFKCNCFCYSQRLTKTDLKILSGVKYWNAVLNYDEIEELLKFKIHLEIKLVGVARLGRHEMVYQIWLFYVRACRIWMQGVQNYALGLDHSVFIARLYEMPAKGQVLYIGQLVPKQSTYTNMLCIRHVLKSHTEHVRKFSIHRYWKPWSCWEVFVFGALVFKYLYQ